ncbi:metallophosphoesterase family protein [Anaeromicropila populeti]|uniref:Phosphoesterase n=1 Tax=Anaeromicropila populeti TaxID=37658 RepID=A0A1I6KL93_9FIRM|nr:metallophosphoesterase family protein [Anaeromicropila populeti]SFR92032.1 phosphoesterase, MJ0936 family [Anaeromicropila populeti]
MKLAVLSDIHSNYIAFETCISYIEHNQVDGILFLGDNISDCPNPERTLGLIKELDHNYMTFHIRGNREEYFIDHKDGKSDNWEYSSYRGSLLYTYEHITAADIEHFRQQENCRVIQIEGTAPITMVHGSPCSSRELLYANSEKTREYMEELTTDYLLCGHTHRQFSYQYCNKLLINPGSVGVAIGCPATAHFAMLEWKQNKWEYQLISLPFDFKEVECFFLKSSLMEKAYVWPKCILKSMETGINMGPLCAKAAYDMAVSDGINAKNNNIPELYWRRAAKELGIVS